MALVNLEVKKSNVADWTQISFSGLTELTASVALNKDNVFLPHQKTVVDLVPLLGLLHLEVARVDVGVLGGGLGPRGRALGDVAHAAGGGGDGAAGQQGGGRHLDQRQAAQEFAAVLGVRDRESQRDVFCRSKRRHIWG